MTHAHALFFVTPVVTPLFKGGPLTCSSPRAAPVTQPHPFHTIPCYRLSKPRSHPSTTLLPGRLPTLSCASSSSSETTAPSSGNVAAILLAGGIGSRMKADRPKQFLVLQGKTILEHSILLFGHMSEISQLIIVLSHEFRTQFQPLIAKLPCTVTFADPGTERQDSVYNGLSQVSPSMSLACIHDAARPLVTEENIRQVLHDASEHGAAVLGVPSKATIKESEDGQFVLRTIPRQRLWEIQTPQVIKPDLLKRGFENVHANDLAVTDDVSIVEQLGEPVKITMGEYTNIKITTPEDMDIAESILSQRQQQQQQQIASLDLASNK